MQGPEEGAPEKEKLRASNNVTQTARQIAEQFPANRTEHLNPFTCLIRHQQRTTIEEDYNLYYVFPEAAS